MKKILLLTLVLFGAASFSMEELESKKSSAGNSLVEITNGVRTVAMGIWPAIVKIEVYRAKLLVSDPKLFKKGADALNSLLEMKAFDLQLQFSRSVPSDRLLASVLEAQSVNEVKASDKMNAFMLVMANVGAMQAGEVLEFSVDRTEGIMRVSKGEAYSAAILGDDTFFINVFSAWLGKTATGDEGMAKLRASLVGQ